MTKSQNVLTALQALFSYVGFILIAIVVFFFAGSVQAHPEHEAEGPEGMSVDVQWESWCGFCQNLLARLEATGDEPSLEVRWRVSDSTNDADRNRLSKFGQVMEWLPDEKTRFSEVCGDMSSAVPVAATSMGECLIGVPGIHDLLSQNALTMIEGEQPQVQVPEGSQEATEALEE